MNDSLNTLVRALEAKHITRNIVCPSARKIAVFNSFNIPRAIDIIDERSAGYVATGMCAEADEPVVIWCADNDSYRNLSSALTEAYYRKLPILVVALSCENKIDQTMNPYDTIRYYVKNTMSNRTNTEQDVTKAISFLYTDIKGPVYLSLGTYQKTIAKEEDSMVDGRINATMISNIIPSEACVHVGQNITCECNHICDVQFRHDHSTKDGNLSMLIGSSLTATHQLHIGIFSYDELAYDLNMLGNRHITGNIVIFSLIQTDQTSAILDVARQFNWTPLRVCISEIGNIKDNLVIGDKPQYIEVVL